MVALCGQSILQIWLLKIIWKWVFACGKHNVIKYIYAKNLRLSQWLRKHAHEANSVAAFSYVPPFSLLHLLSKFMCHGRKVLSTVLELSCALADSLVLLRKTKQIKMCFVVRISVWYSLGEDEVSAAKNITSSFSPRSRSLSFACEAIAEVSCKNNHNHVRH